MLSIKIELSQNNKTIPTDESKLGFGKIFTDHMFIMDYIDGEWKDAKIIPYAPLSLDPSASVFHYGQEVFEGMKAYKTSNGDLERTPGPI